MSPVTQALSGTYINSKGTSFTNAITLQPFQSSLLYKATVDVIYTEPYIQNKMSSKLKFKGVRIL